LNTEQGGVVKGHNKKRIHRKWKGTKESVCQGLLLVPIHRDTQMDLKTEKGGVVKGHNKKHEN
jgi:hypothetical protein